MMTAERVHLLRQMIVADQERDLALIESWADRAAADGYPMAERDHRQVAAALRAKPYPWERDPTWPACQEPTSGGHLPDRAGCDDVRGAAGDRG